MQGLDIQADGEKEASRKESPQQVSRYQSVRFPFASAQKSKGNDEWDWEQNPERRIRK